MKPKASYKWRMKSTDTAWLIWSNKWGCWYRASSQGYTRDVLQAGIFTRAEAEQHYAPNVPRSHRVTEPFPLSAAKRLLQEEAAKARDRLAEAEARVARCEVMMRAARRLA